MHTNESMLRVRPADLDFLKDRFLLWDEMASVRALSFDSEGAVEAYRHAIETARVFPDSYARKTNAIAHEQELAAYWSALSGGAGDASRVIRESIAVYRSDIAASPKPARRRNLAKALKNLAETEERAGRLSDALPAVRESVGVTQALLAEDPRNEEYQIDLQQALLLEIEILLARGLTAEAKQQTQFALTAMRPLAEAPSAPYQHAVDYAELLSTTPFDDLREDAEALGQANQALAATHQLDPGVWRVVALALERNGQFTQAIAAVQKAISLLPPAPPGTHAPDFLKTLQGDLSRLSRATPPQPGQR